MVSKLDLNNFWQNF